VGSKFGNLAADYLELTKPRIAVLVLFSVLAGAVLALGRLPVEMLVVHAVIGTGMVAAASSVLNQLIEAELDRRMARTQDRPIAAGRISPFAALVFAAFLAGSGLVLLRTQVGMLPTLLAATACVLYAGVYTPLKRYSTLNTVVGALPGAIPTLIGWFTFESELKPAAVWLFLLLFFWQFPHFFAIAWLYRRDYERGGMRMLPVTESGVRTIGIQSILYLAAMLVASVLLTRSAGGSAWMVFGSGLAGGLFLAAAIGFARHRHDAAARTLLQASLVYLPIQLVIAMASGMS
jgi:protoheme IX farnesyltransferase